MYISRIEIRNFRNFRYLDIPLSRNAVVIGPNRIGKSNLLYAIRLVLDPSLPDSMRHLRAEDFWDGLGKPFNGSVITVALEISDFENHTDAKALLADALVEMNPAVARITYQFRPKSKVNSKSAGEDEYTFVIFGGGNETQWVSPDLRKMISVTVLPALRDVENDLQSWRRSPLRPLLERLDLDERNVQSILTDLNQATGALLNEAPVKKLANELTERLERMVGAAQSTDTRLGFVSNQADQLLRSVRLFVDGDKSRPLSDASLGTANIIFLALLMQELEARRQVKDSVLTVLAIEEPEAHLHPHVQRLVFRYFLDQGTPLIVTTHSAHIASVTPLDSVVMLKGQLSDGTEARTAQKLNLSDADKADIERYLDVTRAEMLFARGVILVEGVAEQYLIPAIAKTMDIDLDRLGVTVCSVAGTDFGPFYTLLSSDAFDIPCAVITDGDPVETDGNRRFWGVHRATKLLRPMPRRNIIEQHANAGDWDKARHALAEFGIFVGQATLEIDCLGSLDNEIFATYKEFPMSRRRLDRFTELMSLAKAGDVQAGRDLVSRIELLGKGRFAQRLAAHINMPNAPEYIRAALIWITRRLGIL